jgi:hypothetical protein
LIEAADALAPGRKRKEDCGMTDTATIEISVDTFSDGGGFFVRTEIEARCVNIHGPFPDAQAAQQAKAAQLTHLRQISDSLCEPLRRAASTLPQG